jgi:hypothetical protein
MRYAQGGGYTPAEQQRRERLRLEAAGRSARGDMISKIAHDLGLRGAGGGRVSVAVVACYRPGDRPHLSCQLWPAAAARARPGGFTWQDLTGI